MAAGHVSENPLLFGRGLTGLLLLLWSLANTTATATPTPQSKNMIG